MSQPIVVTGTNTGIEKTLFSAGLAHLLGANYWKPIQAGLEGETDSQLALRLGGLAAERIIPELYRLRTPASPHYSAEVDRVRIDTDLLRIRAVGQRPLVIEGAGGLMVPLTRRTLTLMFSRGGNFRSCFAQVDALESACWNEIPAAFIVEPLVLGAGGMLMCPAWVLREMKRICEAWGVLFIADEVMTGWARTGTLFACEQADITPDIACYSKGLTGGALPLAATLRRSDIFDAHYSKDRTRTLFHSSSYTANRVACAAAKANLELWQDPKTHQRVASVATMQAHEIEPFRDDPRFANVRRTGTITALDLKSSEAGYLADIGPKLQEFYKGRNLLLRPLGNTTYVMPSYCVTPADLEQIYAGIRDAADTVT